jgi:hypothetical protein
MPSTGFETPIPVIKRLQSYVLDRAATGIGEQIHMPINDLVTSLNHLPLFRLDMFQLVVLVLFTSVLRRTGCTNADI